jgi:Bacteriophage HK97-gp10, putative tail-component
MAASQRPSRFVINPAGVRELLTSPSGPIYQDLLRRAIRVESRAKILASGRPGPRVDTGRLRASITHRLLSSPEGVYAEVGTVVEYASFVEFGTTPHTIRPTVRKALYWKGAEHPVFVVHHPGNKPYPFLRPALLAAAD